MMASMLSFVVHTWFCVQWWFLDTIHRLVLAFGHFGPCCIAGLGLQRFGRCLGGLASPCFAKWVVSICMLWPRQAGLQQWCASYLDGRQAGLDGHLVLLGHRRRNP